MTLTSLALTVLLADPLLLRADFSNADDLARFEVHDGAAKVTGGAASLPEGATLRSAELFAGDIRLDVELALAASGRARVGIGRGAVSCELTRGDGELHVTLIDGDVEASAVVAGDRERVHVRLRNRGEAIDVAIDGAVLLEHVRETVIRGGVIDITARSGDVSVDVVLLHRMRFDDGVEVSGVDEARRSNLATLDPSRFTLLDPSPSRIDPTYLLAVDEDGDGAADGALIEIHHDGVRVDDGIPLLEQALALADIRPYLRWRVLDGADETAPEAAGGPWGPYLVTDLPGMVEVVALTGSPLRWPAVTAYDHTNDRILDRCCPSGPLRRNVISEIPPDCDELRIELIIQGRDKVTHLLPIERR